MTGRVHTDVLDLFDYLCERFNAEVEPIIKGHSWGWAYRPIRGVTTTFSNHASGTAIDLNAPAHPMGVANTFTPAKRAKIREIVASLEGVVFWGGEWKNRPDDMHFEVRGTATRVAEVMRNIRKAPSVEQEQEQKQKGILGMSQNIRHYYGKDQKFPTGKSTYVLAHPKGWWWLHETPGLTHITVSGYSMAGQNCQIFIHAEKNVNGKTQARLIGRAPLPVGTGSFSGTAQAVLAKGEAIRLVVANHSGKEAVLHNVSTAITFEG